MQIAGHRSNFGQCSGGGIGELTAFGGEFDAARQTLKQRSPQQCFEPAHVVANCAGGEVQFFGGMREILVARSGCKHAQRR
ncbi:hypothetical protein OC00_08070 [Xanthomonas vasicola]|nr:hypothetical protein NX09_11515 [Xanthomonas vasicola]KGR55623.1 hypothetical protein NX07_00300 [Xanthomonas vasicola]KGT84500.1 hypothetical protein OC00_08070 [Xanthomonas vasicola]